MFNVKNVKPTSSSKMEVVELKPQAEKQAKVAMKVCADVEVNR